MSTSGRSVAASTATSDILAAIAELIAQRVSESVLEGLKAHGATEPPSAPKPDFYTEGEVARRSSLSVRTLQSWRSRNRGPLYVHVGRRVLYPRIELEKFLKGSGTSGAKQGPSTR
jgi:hypothetical protein